MERASCRLGDIIEDFGRKVAIRHSRILNTIGRPPGKTNVMPIGFQQGTLHVEIEQQDRSFAIAQFCESLQKLEVPPIESS